MNNIILTIICSISIIGLSVLIQGGRITKWSNVAWLLLRLNALIIITIVIIVTLIIIRCIIDRAGCSDCIRTYSVFIVWSISNF
jgi:hypothetical protein